MKFNEESFKKALSECKIVRWQNHFENVVKAYLKEEKEQCTIADVSESALRDKIKSVLADIEKMDLEGEWYGFMHDEQNAALVTKLWNYCR